MPLRICVRCLSMVEQAFPPQTCTVPLGAGRRCGGSVFQAPGLAPWKLNRRDQRFLRTLGIDPEPERPLHTRLDDEDPEVRRV